MDAKQLFDLIAEGGTLAVLIVMVWALATEKVVPRSRLEACEKREQQRIAEGDEDQEWARAQMIAGMARIDAMAGKIDRQELVLGEIMRDMEAATRHLSELSERGRR